ncbi:MAG TPA: ECF transporter S component [Candidatus Dormibacteraeota bacterium]|nr:ECF transporter S component [Candidatus Dormibacteraeota bacterium]
MRVAVASLLGLPLFVWPFLGRPLPPDAPALALALGAAGGLLLLELGTRRLDARRLALLAVLAAIDTGLRLAVLQGIGGFSPIFFLVLCAGWVFGPSYGFLVGAFSILVSALAEGGVGPWLPYEVFGCGWVGVAAGLAGLGFRHGGGAAGGFPGWRPLAVLAAVGAATGWVYGALLDVQVWTTAYAGDLGAGWRSGMDTLTALRHFGRFYLLTSLAYDTFRAVGNAAMVLLLGVPVLAGLARVRSRLSFEVVPGEPGG